MTDRSSTRRTAVAGPIAGRVRRPGPSLGPDELPEDPGVADVEVLARPRPLGRLQDHRHVPEPRVVDQVAERLEAQWPRPDPRVAIDAAAAARGSCRSGARPGRGPGRRTGPAASIVSSYSAGGAQGIPRGENMAGVHANAQPLRLARRGRGCGRGARSGGPGRSPGRRSSPGRSRRRRPLGPPVDLVQPAGDPRQPRLLALTRRARRGGSPGRRSPAPRTARTSTAIAAIDFSQSASSGLARLIR